MGRMELYKRWLFFFLSRWIAVLDDIKKNKKIEKPLYLKGLLHGQVEITKVFHIKKFSLFLEFILQRKKDKLNYSFSNPSNYYISPSTHCLSQYFLFWYNMPHSSMASVIKSLETEETAGSPTSNTCGIRTLASPRPLWLYQRTRSVIKKKPKLWPVI